MRTLLISVGVLLVTANGLRSADALYRREVNEKSADPTGKNLVITFQETRRDEKTSTAKVTFVTGASVPGSMFIMRCWYDVATARGAKYFIKLKEWKAEGGSRMYLMGFAQDKSVDPKEYFGLKESLPKSDEHFFSVKQLEPFFKGTK
jgi:hypothetical protein